MKQVARRHGYLVSFMCRPKLPKHVCQRLGICTSSLLDRKIRPEPVRLQRQETNCSRRSANIISAGLLGAWHACAAAAFTTPDHQTATKRYSRPINSMGAESRRFWAKDNRGRDDPRAGRAGRCFDASGEPRRASRSPIPYLYMASQIHAGLDGIGAPSFTPGPSADTPYDPQGRAAGRSRWAEALAALNDSACFSCRLRRRVRRLSTCASSRPRSARLRRRKAAARRGNAAGRDGLGTQGIFRSWRDPPEKWAPRAGRKLSHFENRFLWAARPLKNIEVSKRYMVNRNVNPALHLSLLRCGNEEA